MHSSVDSTWMPHWYTRGIHDRHREVGGERDDRVPQWRRRTSWRVCGRQGAGRPPSSGLRGETARQGGRVARDGQPIAGYARSAACVCVHKAAQKRHRTHRSHRPTTQLIFGDGSGVGRGAIAQLIWLFAWPLTWRAAWTLGCASHACMPSSPPHVQSFSAPPILHRSPHARSEPDSERTPTIPWMT